MTVGSRVVNFQDLPDTFNAHSCAVLFQRRVTSRKKRKNAMLQFCSLRGSVLAIASRIRMLCPDEKHSSQHGLR